MGSGAGALREHCELACPPGAVCSLLAMGVGDVPSTGWGEVGNWPVGIEAAEILWTD